jgi:hypothetical protein
MRAPRRDSPSHKWQMEDRFTTASVPAVSTVYPDEKAPRPVLYGPKGQPLYREPEPFGYSRGATRENEG